jgi:RND family efflux transporter MFP subunit
MKHEFRAHAAAAAPWRAVSQVLLVMVATVLVASCSGKAQAPAKPAPLVTVLTPGLSAVTTVATFSGTINAQDEMPITVEGEGGRIAAVLVEVGDRVRRGQVLARLSTSVAQPQVASLQAALEEARTSADLAQAEYRRAQAVAASGALSAEEIERRRGAAANAEARVRSANAQLSESRARLGRTEIRAPADGLVLTRTAEVGQTATVGGEPLFRLGRGGEVEMRGRVAEQDLPGLAVGQEAKVYVTGIDTPFVGTVRLLGAVIDPDTRLGSVRISLKRDPLLRPGAFARGEVIVRADKRPVVPQTAVLSDPRGTYVLAVDPNNKVLRVDVRVSGTRNDGVVIESGLTGAERVVATAAAFLTVGETVRPTTAGETAQRTVEAAAKQKAKS